MSDVNKQLFDALKCLIDFYENPASFSGKTGEQRMLMLESQAAKSHSAIHQARQAISAAEQAQAERECGCGWRGPAVDCVRLGEVGPLCPECRETTEQVQQSESVAWEYREFHDDNTVTPGWGKWKRIESEEWAGRAIKSVVADIHEFIAQGYRYELRALYAKPPAVADRDAIRRIFMAHGFTIKDGQTDLKPYVYEAAEALLRELAPAVAVPGAVDLLREMEWENNRFADACPVCASNREQGHAADCKLAAVLAAAPQGEAK